MKKIIVIVPFVLQAIDASSGLGNPRERVAVAEAIVYANQHARPSLPIDAFQSKSSTAPTPLTSAEFNARQNEQISALIQELNQSHEMINAANQHIAELEIASGPVDRSGFHPAASLVPPNGAGGLSPMRLELPKDVLPIAKAAPRAQLLLEVADYCPPCQRLKRDIMKTLIPKGWDIGEHEDSQIRLVSGTEQISYPRITLYQNGKMLDRWNGYQDPGFLSQRLRAAWDEAAEPVNSLPSRGSAGTIHAAQQIQQTISYLKQYLGDGNALTIIWDRSEARLNLLATNDITAKDLCGLAGRIQVDAPNAIRVPVKSLAISYQLIGKDVRISPESFTVPGLAELLNPNRSTAYGSAPAKLMILDDSLLIYSVCQMLYAIFELLHPSADLILPDQLIVSVSLQSETIHIDFEKSPSVCLKWLFTFNLAVKRVAITARNVHVEFTGSRWIHSRDFDVQ